MNVVISQPRYLPALVYLNRICNADKFIILDTVQRQPRGWENRNKLLTNEGIAKWLTIPIGSSKRALITDTAVEETDWINRHIEVVSSYYSKHSNYDSNVLEGYYSAISTEKNITLSFPKILMSGLIYLRDIMGCQTEIELASSMDTDRSNWNTGPDELVRIALLSGANTYISGPNGREYGVEDTFEATGINVLFHNYFDKRYSQKNSSEFVPYLGFWDALFNMGFNSFYDVCNEPWKLIK